MKQTEYEQKRRECWKDFCRELLPNDDSEATVQDVLDYAFDRAYALGKQEKDAEDGSLWSRLTDDEKREMQCRYHTNECVLRDHKKRTGDKAQSKAVARMKLLESLFGKDNLKNHKTNKEQDTVIQGWVLVDEETFQRIVRVHKITCGDYEAVWDSGEPEFNLEEVFPDMDSDSDPQPVEIIIKRKKK